MHLNFQRQKLNNFLYTDRFWNANKNVLYTTLQYSTSVI